MRIRAGGQRALRLAVAGLVAVLAIGVGILGAGGRLGPGSTALPSVGLGPATVLDRPEAGSALLVTTAERVLVVLAFGMADAPTCPPGRIGAIDAAGRLRWQADPPAQLFTVAGLATTRTVVADGLGTDCAPGPFVSTDAGTTWQARPRPGGFTLPMPWLALDPTDPGSVLAWTTGRLFVGSDLGRTWLSRPSSVRPLAIASGGRLFGWSSGGLATSTDGGARWVPFGASAPSTVEPRAAVAWGESVVLGGPAGLVRVDADAEPITLLSADALAVSVGGSPGPNYLAAVVLESDGTPSLVVSRDGDAIERAPLPEGLRLSGRPVAASIAAANGQVVVALSDGQGVTLIRVSVPLP